MGASASTIQQYFDMRIHNSQKTFGFLIRRLVVQFQMSSVGRLVAIVFPKGVVFLV
jgi:hypothetical protein